MPIGLWQSSKNYFFEQAFLLNLEGYKAHEIDEKRI